ncbi:ABC transporter ATP-binding protein [Wenzhouxiangella sp. AB-CW3]|uniref:ABC transporter ATP-binding protein n=1 Tax=Wenzhouxiangella sp. AB-CW3 TaxID=2771012 RepID=UPI00168A7789|nr:ABC transporter ATP-binding protein [Wenzhouxiangella sp. AB-CW3]QOC22716.1 ABC transporter ATP-binding protein [Wenzhouxiangella sp. AB-CW3]
MNDSITIELSGLDKHFGAVHALREVSATARASDIIGLVGRNGAGKTTLLETLAGLQFADRGRARVLGCDSGRMDDQTRNRLGMVLQDDELFGWLTVDRHIDLVGRFYSRFDRSRIEELLNGWGVALQRKVGNLSRGQRQMVGIALALGHDPDVLLLDEPASALDPVARQSFLQELVSIACDSARTIVFSTHLIGDLERIANRLWLMRDGELVHTLAVSDHADRGVPTGRWLGDLAGLADRADHCGDGRQSGATDASVAVASAVAIRPETALPGARSSHRGCLPASLGAGRSRSSTCPAGHCNPVAGLAGHGCGVALRPEWTDVAGPAHLAGRPPGHHQPGGIHCGVRADRNCYRCGSGGVELAHMQQAQCRGSRLSGKAAPLLRDRPRQPLGWRLMAAYLLFGVLLMTLFWEPADVLAGRDGPQEFFFLAGSITFLSVIFLGLSTAHELLNFRARLRFLILLPGHDRDQLRLMAAGGLCRAWLVLALPPQLVLIAGAGRTEDVDGAQVALFSLAALGGLAVLATLALRVVAIENHSASVLGLVGMGVLAMAGGLSGYRLWTLEPEPWVVFGCLLASGLVGLGCWIWAAAAWRRLSLPRIDHWPLIRLARESSFG